MHSTTYPNQTRPQGQSQAQNPIAGANMYASTGQQQQQQQQLSSTAQLPEKDQLFTILGELKRTAREYTIAVTEANSPSVRRLFVDLLNSTLSMQGHVYEIMKQNNQYSTPSPALKQEIDKQIREHQQTDQQTQQLVQQVTGIASSHGIYGAMAGGQAQQQPSSRQTAYM
jgi:spore coat protein CotF